MSDIPKKQEDIGNIFDDFTVNESLKKEIQKSDEESKKDIFYYISYGNQALSIINIIAIFTIVILFGYVFVQKSEQMGMYGFLEPMCKVFLGRDDIFQPGCSSVTSTYALYSSRLDDEEKAQSDILASLIPSVYSIGDFFSSRRVDFALSNSESRIRPLEMLADFDILQSQFAPIDKLEVQCPEITIMGDSTMILNCRAFSSDWDTSIYRLEDGILRQAENTGGTSISKAANFIDFIEKYPESRFRIVDRPFAFTAEPVQFFQYTKVTNFSFTVEYVTNTLIY